jgi:hypothetical protein
MQIHCQLLLFVPKIRYAEQRRSSIRTDGITANGIKPTQPATTPITNAGKASSLEEDEEDESFRGERVLANKSKRDLAEEMQMRRRLLKGREVRGEAECSDHSLEVVPATTNWNGAVLAENGENTAPVDSSDITQTKLIT